MADGQGCDCREVTGGRKKPRDRGGPEAMAKAGERLDGFRIPYSPAGVNCAGVFLFQGQHRRGQDGRRRDRALLARCGEQSFLGVGDQSYGGFGGPKMKCLAWEEYDLAHPTGYIVLSMQPSE